MRNLDVQVFVLADNKSQLTVKVPTKDIQAKVEAKIRSVAKTARIDSFRKAKCLYHTFVRNTVLAFNKKSLTTQSEIRCLMP